MKCIIVKEIETPLGAMIAAAVDDAVCMLTFLDDVRLPQKISRIKKYFRADVVEDNCEVLTLLEAELNNYFSGSADSFSVPIIMSGTVFQQQVWTVLQEINRGKTWSYLTQAKQLGDARKVRAVATANAANLLCILIPCHRVVASNGQLSGYNGGLWRKEKLLQLERTTEANLDANLFINDQR